MTGQGQSEDALSAVAPLDQHSGTGKRLRLSHESSTSCQTMNVCIHNTESALLYNYSCDEEDSEAGCTNGHRQVISIP